MNVSRLLLRAASVAPGSPAIQRGEEVLCDYRGFSRRAGQLAATLSRDLALPPGERIAILLQNRHEYLELLWGAWTAGLAVVPINARLHQREVDFILADSGARMLFTSRELGSDLERGSATVVEVGSPGYAAMFGNAVVPPAARAPGDLAWLFYTSGTTGRPKGVMITHRNLISMALCYFADVDLIVPEDASLYAAPMSHGAGLYCVPHVLAAAPHVVPPSGGFDPEEILQLASRLQRVSMFAAPTMVNRLVAQAEAQGCRGDGIKTVVYGGGSMYAEDIRRAMGVMGPRFVQIYGQGECPMAIIALSRAHLMDQGHPRHAQRTASVGVAQSNVEVRVEGGDLMISGGSNIYPREVEEVLLRHPSVREAAVIGRPGPEWASRWLRTSYRAPARSCARRNWTRCAWTALRASSGPFITDCSTSCRRTTTARSSRRPCVRSTPPARA